MARGLGTRMRRPDDAAPLSDEQARVAATGVKAMIPVGRPFLDYTLAALADAGAVEICLVTGPEHGAVRDYYDGLGLTRITIQHAIQAAPLGTADAVLAARSFSGADPFLVLNSDNYYPCAALAALRQLDGPGLVAFTRAGLMERTGVPRERAESFPVVVPGEDGHLQRLGTSGTGNDEAMTSMNCWRFSPRIFEACRAIGPSPRGELELPDAVQYSIDVLGERYRVIGSGEGVFDISTRGDIDRVQRHFLHQSVRL